MSNRPSRPEEPRGSVVASRESNLHHASKRPVEKVGGAGPDEPIRQARASRWRVLVSAGGLLLASTFFMPAIQGCGAPIVPAYEVADVFSSSIDLETVTSTFVVFMAAYLWGLVIAIAAIRRRVRGHSGPAERGWGTFGVFTTSIALLVAWSAQQLLRYGPSGNVVPLVLGLAICVMVMAYLLVALIKLEHRAYLAVSFLGVSVATIWFGFFVLGGLYGVRLSFAAILTILVGIVGESVALTGHGWRRTIWLLATCRLRDASPLRGVCPGCAYNLRGVSEMRCPECGRPFQFEELGLSPQELGFQAELPADVQD